MDFVNALKLAMFVIRDERELNEIYLYEISSQTRVYLKDFEGCVEFFARDEPLPAQIFLAGVVNNRIAKKQLSLEVIFSCEWEVRFQKKQLFKATVKQLGKKGEFIDYIPVVGKEEVQDV